MARLSRRGPGHDCVFHRTRSRRRSRVRGCPTPQSHGRLQPRILRLLAAVCRIVRSHRLFPEAHPSQPSISLKRPVDVQPQRLFVSARKPAVEVSSPTDSLYAAREKIYPRKVHGWFAAWRVSAVVALMGLFYGVCWLSTDGRQWLLFDLPARKFNVLWWTFYPQDFLYLTFLLITAALALFFFTALAGRLWCGYACPQSVYTEVFLWIERRIEGDRLRQQKLDRAPWSARKFLKKGTKHGIWLLFALWTGFTFVGYFTPITELGTRLVSFDLGPWETFWTLFYALATYGNAGWMREQVCIYLCPYARFQSAMFDADTLVISYDEARGEPRGSRRRGSASKNLGECIDCTLCVQVCPTGIDIRDGLQYQCIACASCIDVCNTVMHKMGYERGLVRYTTANAVAGKPTKLMRPRLFVYIGILTLVMSGLIVSILSRTALELDVLRDRNALYRTLPSGRIENVYTLKVVNMDEHAHRYLYEVSGLPTMRLESSATDREIKAGEVSSIPVRVSVQASTVRERSQTITFRLTAADDVTLSVSEPARFLGPIKH
jgi:cytochrome c oxidase accessory protein FixG